MLPSSKLNFDLPEMNGSWAEMVEEYYEEKDGEKEEEETVEKAKEEQSEKQTRRVLNRRPRKASSPKQILETQPRFEQRQLKISTNSSGLHRGERVNTNNDHHSRSRSPYQKKQSTWKTEEIKSSSRKRKQLPSLSDFVIEGASKRKSPRKHQSSYANENINERTSTPKSGRKLHKTTDSIRTPKTSCPELWEEPKLGWCNDDKILERRSKEIAKAKEKDVYSRYITAVPFAKRIKYVHPRTPNKLINYSRRSWDSMIRKWKRSLYGWAGEEPSPSANVSFCESGSEMSAMEDEDTNVVVKVSDVKVRDDSDAMASLLGHFDMDSQRGLKKEDEKTLEAMSNDGDTLTASERAEGRPVDFSALNAS